jgi:hypothetical protein
MNWKIVLAGSIALGFLDLGELSVVQKAVAGDNGCTIGRYQKEKDCHAPAGAEPGRVHRARMPSHSSRLPPPNGLQLGWNPDRLRYYRLSGAASPLKSGVNFRRFRG